MIAVVQVEIEPLLAQAGQDRSGAHFTDGVAGRPKHIGERTAAARVRVAYEHALGAARSDHRGHYMAE